MNKKFEYFLNAVHYCLWLGEIKSSDFIGRIIDKLLSPVPKYLFTKKYREKYEKRLPETQKEMEWIFNDKENGVNIGSANHWFGFFYSGYPCFLSFVLCGIVFGLFGAVNPIVTLAICVLPICLCYIPAYKAVFTKNRYLKYFKQFEKEDEQWHKKWKWITIAFVIGSEVFTIGGIFAMSGVCLFFRGEYIE